MSAPVTSGTTVNYGIRLTSRRMTVLVIAFHGSLAELAICMAVTGVGVGMVTSSFGLVYVEDIPPEHVGRMFGISPILAAGLCLLATAFAAVYLVTYWSGFRGDRAMVRRPGIEGAEGDLPAATS